MYNASRLERVNGLAALGQQSIAKRMRTGHSGRSRSRMYRGEVFRGLTSVAQGLAGIGLAEIDGYFSGRPRGTPYASDTFQPWRSHAQATSGDLQPGPGAPPDRDRSDRIATQLPVLRFRRIRTRTESHPAAAPIPRDTDVQFVRKNGTLYCGRRLEGASQTSSIVGARALGRLRVREHFSLRSAHFGVGRFPSVPSAVGGSDTLHR